MISPETAILTGAAILLILALFFFPGKGLWFRYRKNRKQTKRVLMEDTLKYLYHCEYENISCTPDSIAGNLGITRDKAADIILLLEDMNLIRKRADSFELTSEGRTYALRVIRTHRLWERYLADETSFAEQDWHTAAEELEHSLEEEEVNSLAAKLGNPVFDPHGDPIPSAEGNIPPRQGITLRSLEPGDAAKITHLEDEPETIYAQLLAEGLHPGMQVRMLETNNKRVRFVANNDECVIAPVFADNIQVKKIDRDEVIHNFEALASLDEGERCEVVGISNAIRGQQRRRLMDIGIVPGSVIEAEMKSISGNPTAYRIRGALIALRKNHTQHIYINRKTDKSKIK